MKRSLLALPFLLCACGEAPEEALFERFQIEPALGVFSEVRDSSGAVFLEKRGAESVRRQRFPRLKPAGVVRVFIVGGSVAEILNEDPSVHPDVREALEGILPGRRFEVVNAGRGGYDSERDLAVAREVLGCGADLLLVLSGPNEGFSSPPASPGMARLYRALRGIPPLGRWLRRRLSRPPPSPAGQASALVLERFEENLWRIVEAARAADVPVVLCALPVNIRDMPPLGSLPLSDGAFFDGWLAWETGRWRDAAAAFRKAAAQGDPSGFGRYYLARSLDKAGDSAAARREYLGCAAQFSRQMPLRNVIVRRVAGRGAAVLADLESAFAELSPLGLPGRELFEDDVHWRAPADAWVAATLAEALAEAGARGGLRRLAPPEAWRRDGLSRRHAELAARLRGRKPDPGRSLRLFRVWMWPPLKAGTALSERVLSVMESVRLASPGLLASAGEFKEWFRDDLKESFWGDGVSRGLDAWWPRLLAHAGEVHRRHREFSRAVRRFEEALALDPGLQDVRPLLAVSLFALGEKRRAEAAAAPLSPQEKERVSRWGAALRALPRAPEPRGGDAGPAAAEAMEWTRFLWTIDRKDAAFRGLDRILKAHPGDREALGQRRAWLEALAAEDARSHAPAPASGAPSVPRVPPPADPRVRGLNDEGIRLFTEGKVSEAALKFAAALRLDPRSLDAVMNSAAAASRSGDPEKALGFYAAALTLAAGEPGNLADALSSRASVLAAAGRRAEAVQDLERALGMRGLDGKKRSLLEEELKGLKQAQSRSPAMRRP